MRTVQGNWTPEVLSLQGTPLIPVAQQAGCVWSAGASPLLITAPLLNEQPVGDRVPAS